AAAAATTGGWTTTARTGAASRRGLGRLRAGRRHEAARAEDGAALAGLRRVQVVHHDDHRDGLPLGDQVVEDDVDVALPVPAGLVLTPAVEQVEHRIASAGVRVVVGRRVDVGAAPLAGDLREVPLLRDLA